VKRIATLSALFALLLVGPALAETHTYFGFNIGIGKRARRRAGAVLSAATRGPGPQH
jgi:hypothetical protein